MCWPAATIGAPEPACDMAATILMITAPALGAPGAAMLSEDFCDLWYVSASRSWGVDATSTLFPRHGWDIHAVRHDNTSVADGREAMALQLSAII